MDAVQAVGMIRGKFREVGSPATIGKLKGVLIHRFHRFHRFLGRGGRNGRELLSAVATATLRDERPA